jgi:putative ABC transport system permease protein
VPAARLLIMTGQVAIACTLLIGAALLGRSFLAMLNTDRGFDPGHLLTARLAMPDFAFTPQRRLEVLDAILRRLRQLPGAAGIGFTTGLPLISSETVSGFTMPSHRPPAGAPVQVHSVRSVVSQDYFRTLGMRIADGRGFSDEDTASSPRVAIVNRAFARQYLSEQPVGDRISNFARGDGVEYEVIGIVDDVRKRGVTENVSPEIYSLDRQMSPSTFNPNLGSLVLRGSADPRALLEPLKTVLKEQDSSLALESIMTMEDRLSASLARPRFYAVLVGAFALCALAIAGVGLFGVLSYSVAQRSREIAIRTALGARPWDVVRIVLKQGLAATAAGLSIGISVSLAATSYLATLLYGVAPRDWPTIVAVSLSIGAIAAAACLAPALRAARIEPRSAMRAGM